MTIVSSSCPDRDPFADLTIPGALAVAARESGRSRWYFPQLGVETSLAQMCDGGFRVARALRAAGVGPGDVVAVLAVPGANVWQAMFGVLAAGAAATALALRPVRGDLATEVAGYARIIEAAGIRHLIVAPELADLGTALRAVHPDLVCWTPRELEAGGTAALPDVAPGAPAVIQFTSGSTGNPKGVVLTHAAVLAHAYGLRTAAAIGPEDVLVQWVPHYHDMGLFAPLALTLAGADVHVDSPLSFVRDPAGYLNYLARHRGTITSGPDFGYDLLTRTAAGLPGPVDLSAWRLAFNGAEPIREATIRRFADALAPHGVGPGVMYPCFGMAEATLAVTLRVPGRPPRVLHVDRDVLADRRTVAPVDPASAAAKAVVALGAPLPGMSLRIVGADGLAGPGELGEIQLRGPNLTTGYLNEPERTAELFDEGWLRTGDLGFVDDGELFIAGRAKEMIIVNGHNLFPQDVEEVARTVPGVHRRRCVAVAVHDAETEHILVAAECDDPEQGPAVERRIRAVVVDALGVGAGAIRVAILAPGSIPRTTSGKWQRSLVRSRFATVAPA
ncbi:AMP-binding protein [Nocardia sp. BMG111209]|uniref:AMP-binding protein n=1 Tax=Nocardia sp. BMG111209 TaxID=1160137 RepID=UPI000375C317|nr:AMP-binding protein [Nocardia sp. BMG111209]